MDGAGSSVLGVGCAEVWVESPAGPAVDESELEGPAPEVVEADVALDVDDSVGSSVMVLTTTNWLDSRFQVAQTSGSEGRTSKRPTPLLQQFVAWSQQYDVSMPVTFEQEIRSVPPLLAPDEFLWSVHASSRRGLRDCCARYSLKQ